MNLCDDEIENNFLKGRIDKQSDFINFIKSEQIDNDIQNVRKSKVLQKK